MSDFHFLRPEWFLALIPMLLLLALLWRKHSMTSGWQAIVSAQILPHLLLNHEKAVSRLPLTLLGLGWLLAVTAMAGPTWERQPQPAYLAPIDRVLVLDMSPSMAAADLKPNRLTRAHLAIRTLLTEAKEGRAALVVFGAEPHVVTPLTDDTATIEALLPALSTDIIPAPGDQGGPALRMAAKLLQRVGSVRGEVLLISDGVNDPAATLEAIQDLRHRGVPTSVLGVGTPEGAPVPAAHGGFETTSSGGTRLARIDNAALVELAKAGGGRYQRLGQGPVTTLLTQHAGQDLTYAKKDRHGLDRWVEQGPWLLLPLLMLAAMGFRRGWLGVMVILLIPPPPAQAFGWQDLWLRPDQQASQLLKQGKSAAAAERFKDPQWRALAHYQAGNYANAVKGFTSTDADSHYNRGNALAKSGKLQEALSAYDKALELQPKDKDAQFNRALVEKLLRSQQQKSGQSSKPNNAQNNSQAGAGKKGNSDQHDQKRSGSPEQSRSPSDNAANQSGQKSSPQNTAGSNSHPDNATNQSEQKKPSPQNTAGSDSHPADNKTADASKTGEKPTPLGKDSSERTKKTEQAHADVAPTVDAKTGTQSKNTAATTTGQIRQHKDSTRGDDTKSPLSEKQIALEQWLHQVPDDPSGLLRRKFMIEHLLRQRRQAP